MLTALKPDGTPAVGVELKFAFDAGGAGFEVTANGDSVKADPPPKTDANGKVEIDCKALDDTSKSVVTVSATIDGAGVSTSLTLQAKP
ncbi:hypothetical protein GPU89_08370 [Burkholderia cepacia]|nr:hypothetical protein [Burkholderia cepacia]